MTETMNDAIVAIIRKTLRQPELEVLPSMGLAELGIESLDMVEMLFEVEDRFGIEIPFNANVDDDSDGAHLSTVADVVGEVERLVGLKAQAA